MKFYMRELSEHLKLFTVSMRRPVKGRVGIEQERLISAEEGMLFSPLHSRAYFILGTGLEGEDILKEAKQRFIKVVFNIYF